MYQDEEEDTTIYQRVLNDKEPYSIWSAYRENPPDWRDAETSELEPDELASLREVWIAMRAAELTETDGGTSQSVHFGNAGH